MNVISDPQSWLVNGMVFFLENEGHQGHPKMAVFTRK